MKRYYHPALVLLAILLLSGCNVSAPLGATVGGAKDIGYARQIIESGGIPEPEYIVPEGIFGEHDIATPASNCADKLCVSFGYGFAPAVDSGREALFAHVGLTSSIQRDQFRRPRLQLALVIDRSGSMEGGSMEAVKEALRRLAEKLTPDDEVMLVSFNNSAQTLYGPALLGERPGLVAAINGIQPDGGTNIEAGLTLGYEGLAGLPQRQGYSRRVMLFTDAMPNIGATDSRSFAAITGRYADQGIGLTAFGVGVNFGQELVHHITGLRGGNFFFLQNSEKIRSVFDDEFDLLVTPIVHDMKLKVTPPTGLKLRAVYGLPTWIAGSQTVELNVPTVFFSTNRGAIMVRFERADGEPLRMEPGALLATGTLDYTDIDGKHVAQSVELRNTGVELAPGVRAYSGDGTRLGVALTNIAIALRGACENYRSGARQAALDLLERAGADAAIDQAALNDAGLRREMDLLAKLAANIRQR